MNPLKQRIEYEIFAFKENFVWFNKENNRDEFYEQGNVGEPMEFLAAALFTGQRTPALNHPTSSQNTWRGFDERRLSLPRAVAGYS